MNSARHIAIALHILIFSFTIASFTHAQQPSPGASPSTVAAKPLATPTPKLPPVERRFVQHVFKDQEMILTSPFRLKEGDLKWLLPFGAAAAGLIATDHETSGWVQRTGSLPFASRTASIAGKFYVLGGISAGVYLVGKAVRNRHAQESGVLAIEALIDSGIDTQILKYAFERPRPNEDMGRGRFFKHGSSFPSGHASTAWAVATVFAYEYHDQPLVKYGAYAAASIISFSRYSGRNHFLSDILVGSALGFGIGRFVYKTHHVDEPDASGKDITQNSKWVPMIVPRFDRRTSTYGAGLIWTW